MLPKRSTPVDQSLRSESIHSQLSVTIFIPPRNLLGARESLIIYEKCQNGSTQKELELHGHIFARYYQSYLKLNQNKKSSTETYIVKSTISFVGK